MSLNQDDIWARVLDFLTSISLDYKLTELDDSCFLPGLDLKDGVLHIDKAKCVSPGDALHEAGHLAVLLPEERQAFTSQAGGDPKGDESEVAVLLWSYAAAVHLDIPLKVVFHDQGYKGEADWMIDQYSRGNYIGLPLLQWYGLSFDEALAAEQGAKPFPHMQRWLRV